jgi:Spy/CpxP family protein refolding chaperone
MRRTHNIVLAIAATAGLLVAPAMSASAHDGKGGSSKSSKDGSTSTKASHKANVIAALMAAGTITQAQGDAVNAAIKASTLPRSTNDTERRAKYVTITSPLVTAGTITQAQATAIVDAIVADGAKKSTASKPGKSKRTKA